MKALVIVALLIGNSLAQAGDLKSFIGKYKLGKCTIFAGNEAYIGYAKSKTKKVSGVHVAIYGSDPSFFEMLLGETLADNPNFRFGNPVKQVRTSGRFEGTALVVTASDIYIGGAEKLVSTSKLTPTSEGVLYSEVGPKGDETSCEMIRAN